MTPARREDLRRGRSGADGDPQWLPGGGRRDGDLRRTAGEKVRRAYVISATLAPAAVLGNYDVTYNTATFNIAKKAAR